MNITFETLIDTFLTDQVGISNNFLSESLAQQLKLNLLNHHAANALKTAGMGNKDGLAENKAYRNDKIYWLDKQHKDPTENDFFSLMDDFVQYLNQTCYTGIKSYEFHYAMFEKGSFYKRHLDMFKNDDSRQFSMIMYLNSDWLTGDGGELKIYKEDNTSEEYPPTMGKSIFFKSSQLQHEVLTTNVPRLSITGWLKK